MKITGLCMVLLSQVLSKIEDQYPFSVWLSLTIKIVLQNASHISKSTKRTHFYIKCLHSNLIYSAKIIPLRRISLLKSSSYTYSRSLCGHCSSPQLTGRKGTCGGRAAQPIHPTTSISPWTLKWLSRMNPILWLTRVEVRNDIPVTGTTLPLGAEWSVSSSGHPAAVADAAQPQAPPRTWNEIKYTRTNAESTLIPEKRRFCHLIWIPYPHNHEGRPFTPSEGSILFFF